MTARALTRHEADRIRACYAAYLPRPWWKWFHPRDALALAVVVLGGAALASPFAAAFMLVMRYAHQETWPRALEYGALGLAAGAALGMLVFFMGWVEANKSSLPDLAKDLRAGQCVLRRYTCARAWPLVDDGNASAPDLLLDIGKGRVLALPAADLEGAGPPAQTLTLALLPASGVTVEVKFSGAPLPLAAAPLVTDCLWRNDDLPWVQPIRLAKAPPELAQALARAG